MNKTQLEQFAQSLDNENITFHLQTKSGPWYMQEYTNIFDFIETETVYGVCVNSNDIDFIFKTGKKYDNILKTFVTQYINKYKIKQSIGYDTEKCCVAYPDKKEVLNTLKNSNRVSKYYFYTTLYGIGYFCYFMNNETQNKTNLMLGSYLKENGINYKNEFSEAGWVYRFLINDNVKKHNELLKNFNI